MQLKKCIALLRNIAILEVIVIAMCHIEVETYSRLRTLIVELKGDMITTYQIHKTYCRYKFACAS